MKIKEQAIDFFLYSYFGIITKDLEFRNDQRNIKADSKENKIKKCAYRAYLDMCRTLKYNEDNSEDRKLMIESICNKMANILVSDNDTIENKITRLYDFLEDKNNENKEIITLKKSLNHKEMKRSEDIPLGLHFGQVQKWINMTLKYMWLIGELNDDEKKYIEIPIDSVIMHAMSNELEIKFPRYNGTVGTYSESSSVPWSKINEDEYGRIKNKTSNLIPSKIEWECDNWIKYAELKKTKCK